MAATTRTGPPASYSPALPARPEPLPRHERMVTVLAVMAAVIMSVVALALVTLAAAAAVDNQAFFPKHPHTTVSPTQQGATR